MTLEAHIPSSKEPVVIEQSPTTLQTYFRLLKYVKPFWYGWLLALVGFAVAAVSQLAWAELLEWLLETVDKKLYERAPLIAGAILAIFAVRGVATFVGQYALSFVSVKVVAVLRQQIFEKILYLPFQFHQQQSAGRILTLVTYNTEQLSGATTDAVKTLLQEGLLAIALMSYLLYVNWQLSLLFVIMTPIIGWLVTFAAKRLKMISSRIQTSMGDVAQVTSDTVKGFQIVKSFQAESSEMAKFDRANQRSVRQQLKLAVTSGLATPVIQGIVGVQMAILVGLAISPEFLDEVGAPQFMAYITAAGLLVKPAKSLSSINAVLMRGVAAAEQLFAVLDMPVERLTKRLQQDTVPTSNSQQPKTSEPSISELSIGKRQVATDSSDQLVPLNGRVVFKNVSFRYAEHLPAIFENLNFAIESGEMIALVGKTGSGKTTITDLLLGFYQLDGGDIEVGQVSFKAMTLSGLRSHIALVPQFSEVFEGSIRDNIAYGALHGATDEEVERAASMANALEFIHRLPQGIDTPLGEHGVKLSGGQRQRLAIARAVLKNAPILVMDEATSALDNESERSIQHAMLSLRGTATMIIIAHRLSTVEQADRILVLDQGKIIESGNHKTLMQQQGAYAKLYNAQLSEI